MNRITKGLIMGTLGVFISGNMSIILLWLHVY